MKTISKIFGLMVVFGLSIGFSSCSDDDDKGPAAVPVQDTFTKTYSIPLNASSSIETPAYGITTTLKLSDAIGEDAAKNFVAGSAVAGTSMTLKVRGLQAIKDAGKDETLQNFTVKVGNTEISLGTCNVAGGGSNFYSDTPLKGGNYDRVTQAVFDLLTTSKEAKIAYKFKPAVTISVEDGLNPVYLDITVVAEKYTYNTYPDKK